MNKEGNPDNAIVKILKEQARLDQRKDVINKLWKLICDNAMLFTDAEIMAFPLINGNNAIVGKKRRDEHFAELTEKYGAEEWNKPSDPAESVAALIVATQVAEDMIKASEK